MDFFPALKAKAAALKNGEGLHIIQTFEPVPPYPVLALMGFEHHTERRAARNTMSGSGRTYRPAEGDSSLPFKPLALLNYPMIDAGWGGSPWDFWGDHMAE